MAEIGYFDRAQLDQYEKMVQEEWMSHTLLMEYIKKYGKVGKAGGKQATWDARTQRRGNIHTIGRFESAVFNDESNLATMSLPMSSYGTSIPYADHDIVRNQGDWAVRKFVEDETKYAVASFKEFLAQQVWDGDGAADAGHGGIKLYGIHQAIPNTNLTAKSYGGVPFTGNSWHAPHQIDGDGGANTDWVDDADERVRYALSQATKQYPDGMSSPQAGFGTKANVHHIKNLLAANQRQIITIEDTKKPLIVGGKVDCAVLDNGTPVYADEFQTAGLVHLLNFSGMELRVPDGRENLIRMEEGPLPNTYGDQGLKIWFRGWFIVRNPRRNAVIHNAAA